MAENSYIPGEWFGIVRAGTVVLLGPGTRPELVGSLWSLLEQSPEAHEVLNEVTGSFGVSLTRIPPFGIIDVKDSLRVFLRGDLELSVAFPSGGQSFHGREVTTWTERRLDVPRGYRLALGSSGVSSTAVELPLAEGVVMLSALAVTVGGSSQGPGAPAATDPVLVFQDDDPGLTIAPGQPLPGRVRPVPGPLDLEPEPVQEAANKPAHDGGATEAETASAPSEVPVHTETTDELVHNIETTSSYDHLWEKTVIRNIEDAAVRLEPVAEQEEARLPTQERDQAGPQSGPEPQDASPAPAVALQSPYPPAQVAASVPGSGTTDTGNGFVDSGLIDSVPWAVGSPSEGAQRQAAPQQSWLPPSPGPVPESLPEGDAGRGGCGGDGSEDNHPLDSDHDGQTIMKPGLALLPADPAEPARHMAPASGPMVLAKVCQDGHANPPTYSQCAGCGLGLPGDGVQVPRPRLGRMRLSSGELIDLDQSLIIGRQPSVSRVQGGAMPRLVQVDSPGGDISRSHVEVRLEGWHVMLCDLKATNGTTLIREGQAPRRLAQNEMAILLDGDIAELGDNISLRFEEIL
ncbi:FHA domain-containing protein [Arthrobacter sp. AZCC_0090]|uniref:FHA domain-containing protein n=1 Tax=Arthrobacter sp. AZCC_0090 TaxID=2735881 RepID=UPI00160E1DF1|nr:FHA domain-containing protein [Arthrobacter sp. AZCC_0090]MBB6403506.1 hypothetical protein [Arthrobacter sp. AZCC_0090]